jgi:hypothetical protein
MLNTARLAERWRDANGHAREELSQDDNQLVTKANLRASVAELRAELNDLKAWMLTRLIAMFGIALGIIALMIRFLSPAAGIQ